MRRDSDLCIRRLERADLAAALALQAQCYPAFLREDEAAFASRLDAAAPYCLAATVDGALAGYLLAHGWPGGSPPEIATILPWDAPSEVLYIHDLAVGAAGRGIGLGRRLVARAFEMAAGDGLRVAELIAVAGAARYWRGLGFAEAEMSPALARKVGTYGAQACWMRRTVEPGTRL